MAEMSRDEALSIVKHSPSCLDYRLAKAQEEGMKNRADYPAESIKFATLKVQRNSLLELTRRVGGTKPSIWSVLRSEADPEQGKSCEFLDKRLAINTEKITPPSAAGANPAVRKQLAIAQQEVQQEIAALDKGFSKHAEYQKFQSLLLEVQKQLHAAFTVLNFPIGR